MSRNTVVYVERPGGWSARVELTSTCVDFSTAVGDVLTPPEFWAMPARLLAAQLDPPSPELSPIPRPPRGHAAFLGGPLHGQVRRSRAIYLDDAGKPVPARRGDAHWTGVLPVPCAFYVRRTAALGPVSPTVGLGHVYVHHSAARLWESRDPAGPENLWASSDAR